VRAGVVGEGSVQEASEHRPRRLRDLTRLRKTQINERARSIQRLEKVLQDAGIKLSSVASTTYSKSARAMLEAIGAIRHDLLVAYHHVVRDQVPYRELGPDPQRKRYSPEHRARRLQRQLEALGYKVNLEQAEQAEQAARTSHNRDPSAVGARPIRSCLPKRGCQRGDSHASLRPERQQAAHLRTGLRLREGESRTNGPPVCGAPSRASPRRLANAAPIR
jgi:hypothetical protein